jgi:hypothetical protein
MVMVKQITARCCANRTNCQAGEPDAELPSGAFGMEMNIVKPGHLPLFHKLSLNSSNDL